MLSRNGMRQPQFTKSGPDNRLKNRTDTLASSRPAGTPNCGQLALKPRRPCRAPLHRQQHRAAPFAADSDALDEAQNAQDDAAGNANGGVARDKRDKERAQAHEHQAGDERRLASNAIAVVSEECGANGAGDEAHEIDGEGVQLTGQRV